MPRGPHRRWKGCPMCKGQKHDAHGDAVRIPRSALKRFPTRRGKRVSRHDVGLWDG